MCKNFLLLFSFVECDRGGELVVIGDLGIDMLNICF